MGFEHSASLLEHRYTVTDVPALPEARNFSNGMFLPDEVQVSVLDGKIKINVYGRRLTASGRPHKQRHGHTSFNSADIAAAVSNIAYDNNDMPLWLLRLVQDAMRRPIDVGTPPAAPADAPAQPQAPDPAPAAVPLKWTAVTVSGPTSVYTAGDYRLEGEQYTYGGGLRRRWTLLYQGAVIGNPSRRDEGKRDAQNHADQRSPKGKP